MSSHEFLRQAMIYLSSGLLSVYVFHRLGLSSVLGYLAAGVLIGPSVLGFIHSPEQVLHFSEFGVVLLLFLIGLELNPRRLWTLRKPIFGMGGAQVLSCACILAAVGWGWGLQGKVALILGFGFALSSTALALQLLREKNLHQILVGESSFSVLLFQDLAVIPMLALVPLLAPSADPSLLANEPNRWMLFIKGISAVGVVVILGRYLVRPVFRAIAKTHLREMFTAFALALVFGVSYLMEIAGLSMALGAFLSGVLLAESEFRHELEVDIEPFKGLLLGLFFIAVGMSMQMSLLKAQPLQVFSLTACLLLAKSAVLFLVAKVFRHSREESLVFAVTLSQGGEFAFVLFGLASQLHVIAPEHKDLFNISIALSMATTPFLFILYEKTVCKCLSEKSIPLGDEHQARPEGNPVILAGFGRIGQVVGRLLHSQSIGITILEQDPGQIEIVKRFGWRTFYGDVSRLDLLRAAGAQEAKLLILAIDDMEAIKRTIPLVREHFPHLKLLVRADSRLDAYHFIQLQVPLIRSTLAPGLEMAEEALKLLGIPSFEARSIGQRFKRYDRVEVLRAAQHSSDLDKLITLSAQSREELTRIMEVDQKKQTLLTDHGWG